MWKATASPEEAPIYNRMMDLVERDVALLKEGLVLPEPAAHPALVMVSGLPGSGKSYFSRQLAERFPFLVVETDVLRHRLSPTPTYSAEESQRPFQACHRLVEELMKKGVSLVLDATNLVETHREYLYHIAEQAGAKLIIVRVEAPEGEIKKRIQRREQGLSWEDHSEADWKVYRRMKEKAQGIRRPHFVVDTSRDIGP